MTTRRWPLVCLALALLLLGVAGFASGASGERPGESVLADVDIDADSVLLDAQLGADGDAAWRVVYRLQLDDDDEIQAFEELQADVEEDPNAYLDPFVDRMERTVDGAAEATGREMSVRNASVRTERDAQPQQEFGVVEFSFEWRGFAALDDERMEAGDAIDRLFLEDDTSLRIGWPDSHRLDGATPEPTFEGSQRVVWRGPFEFDAGEPRVTLVPVEASGVAPDDDTVGDDDLRDGPTALFTNPLVLGLAVLVVLAIAGAIIARRRRGGLPTDWAGDEPEEAEPPSALLSNEERVLQLLEENGGRLKQQRVREELDWTAAKTSKVVGDLRESGQVESFRLGRENVLTLPDVDIHDAGDERDDGATEE